MWWEKTMLYLMQESLGATMNAVTGNMGASRG